MAEEKLTLEPEPFVPADCRPAVSQELVTEAWQVAHALERMAARLDEAAESDDPSHRHHGPSD